MAEYNQEAKADKGKAQLTLVPTDAIRSMARIIEYDNAAEDGMKPKLICQTRKQGKNWKGLFECPYCHETFEAFVSNVIRGKQRSCGCAKGKLMVETKETHGATGTRLYRTWCHIQERCNKPYCKEYTWYGARGIKCEFESFEDFRDYALANGYSDDLTVERINVNGNYAPGNITFIHPRFQPLNTTRSVKITYKGITLCASEWASLLGFNSDTLTSRKRKGWPDEKIIETQTNGSVDVSLVPVKIIDAIRQVREFGCKRYPKGGPDNWRQVEVSRYRDASFRHFLAYLDDPAAVDEESGLPHLWHLACNISFLCEMEGRK